MSCYTIRTRMLSLSCADPLVTFSSSVRTVTFRLCLNSVKVNQQAKDQRSFNSVTVRIQAHTYWTHFALPEPPKWPVKINAAQTQNTSQYQYLFSHSHVYKRHAYIKFHLYYQFATRQCNARWNLKLSTGSRLLQWVVGLQQQTATVA